MSNAAHSLVQALKAAGAPTRLQILVLLKQGDLAVSELVHILNQSQPRLSHHLKTLTQAKLIERLPEGSWVFYRLATKGPFADLIETIFETIDLDEPVFTQDRAALADVRKDRAAQAENYFASIAPDWDNLRSLHYPNEAIEAALLEAAGPGPFERVIDFGTGTGRMLAIFSDRAVEAEGVDMSRHMLSVARGNLAKAEITNARVRQGDVSETPFETDSADLIIVHQVLHFIEEPATVLEEAARVLRPDGKLLIVDFARHQLDFLRLEHGHRRLGLRDEDMREWATGAGLNLHTPRHFDPPETLDQGLRVNVWTATPTQFQKRAHA